MFLLYLAYLTIAGVVAWFILSVLWGMCQSGREERERAEQYEQERREFWQRHKER